MKFSKHTMTSMWWTAWRRKQWIEQTAILITRPEYNLSSTKRIAENRPTWRGCARGRVVALAVSATWLWHGDSLKELRLLSRYTSSRAGISENEGWKTLLAEVGSALARGNSVILNAARNSFTSTLDETRPGFVPPATDGSRSAEDIEWTGV